MKGRHGHNLRSAPHSKRTIRVNSRVGPKSRADSQQQRRSAPGGSELQQHHISETLETTMRTISDHAGDAPAPTTNNMHIIAAQQQQMKTMQEMMRAMQQQMATLQHTIMNMATPPSKEPLITASKGAGQTASSADANPSGGAADNANKHTSDDRTAGIDASGSPDPTVKESTTQQPLSGIAEPMVAGAATNNKDGAGAKHVSRGDGAAQKHKAGGGDGAPLQPNKKGKRDRARYRGSKRRPATGPPLIRSMANAARKSRSKASNPNSKSALKTRKARAASWRAFGFEPISTTDYRKRQFKAVRKAVGRQRADVDPDELMHRRIATYRDRDPRRHRSVYDMPTDESDDYIGGMDESSSDDHPDEAAKQAASYRKELRRRLRGSLTSLR